MSLVVETRKKTNTTTCKSSSVKSSCSIKAVYDKAKSHVSDGLNLDERGDYRKALDCYGKGLKCILESLSLINLQSTDTEELADLKRRILKTKTQVKERIQVLLDLVSREKEKSDPLKQTLAGGKSQDLSVTSTGEKSVLRSTVNTTLSSTISGRSTSATSSAINRSVPTNKIEEAMKDETVPVNAAEIVVRITQGVGLFHVNAKDRVVKFEDMESLHVFRFVDPKPGKPVAFVQAGTWIYPLSTGKSPVLKSSPTTYMFPNLEKEDGSSIGIILGEATEEELEALDEILKSTSIFKEGETTVTSIEEEGTIDKKWGDTVAKGIVTGVDYVNKGLHTGTVYVSKAIAYSGSKIRGNLTPQEKEVEIPVEAKVGVRAANVVTGGVVGVSNFLLDGLATLTVKAGKTVYNVACDAEVVQSYEVNSHLKEAWKVTKTGAKGAASVFVVLEDNGRSLLKQLSAETSKTVGHKFGNQAASITDDGIGTAGHVTELALTYASWKHLGITFLGKVGRAVAKESDQK